MSVFGGDSWAREAQQRKRRVDDLMVSSSSSSSSSFKKLSSGKYACLVCPHNPILDSPLAVSMHNKGTRHMAAESRMKERKLTRQEELNKRIALSSDSTATFNSGAPIKQPKHSTAYNKPLIEHTRKAILETQCNRSQDQNSRVGCHVTKPTREDSPFSYSKVCLSSSQSNSCEKRSDGGTETAVQMLADWNIELRKHQEKELKFTAAGWKRDCHGKWYKDENVEFDSDDEDPNACLS